MILLLWEIGVGEEEQQAKMEAMAVLVYNFYIAIITELYRYKIKAQRIHVSEAIKT